MSTDYRLPKKVRVCDLFDGCLEEFGIREHVKPDETTKKKRCLTDGRNYLWVHMKVRACDLFDGCLEEFGIREHVKPDETTKKKRCLTDGRNYLWVHIYDGGLVACLSRYAPNGDPMKILNAIALAFDVDVVSEYEPQYWGFDTQEEWDAAQEEMSREYEKNFLNELLKYLRGEPNELKPGTIGMTQAEIAQKLVQKDPTLLLPIHKDRLCKIVRMIASHKDDLPRA